MPSSLDREPGERGLIWSRETRAAKGPAPSKSREQIARAAVALGDAEGMEAVSMRKVAGVLGIGAASLYGYVDSKDELYDLMVDWVEGEDGPLPPLSRDWRADVFYLAQRIRASILRHPWMASIAAARPNFGPNSLALTEYGLEAMSVPAGGIDVIYVASEILQSFVRGFTSREIAEQQAVERSGASELQRARAVASWVEASLRTGRYPQFARVVADADLPHVMNRQDVLFGTALDRVLKSLFP